MWFANLDLFSFCYVNKTANVESWKEKENKIIKVSILS